MAQKKNKRGEKGLTKGAMRNKMLGVFKNKPQLSLNYKQMSKQLNVRDLNSKKMIVSLLEEMETAGELEMIRTGKYKLRSRSGYLEGEIQLTSKGKAFLLTGEGSDDIFIAQNNLNTALNGDWVKVYIYARKRRRKPEGEVVEVLKRAREFFTGVLEVFNTYAFLITEKSQIPFDIFIPLRSIRKAKNMQRVKVKITEWPPNGKSPVGEVVEVLGDCGDTTAEVNTILVNHNLPYTYPGNVIEEAEKIKPEISKEEIKKRRDFRAVSTFTIDPHDAKDFDDALSFKKLKNGNYEVGIHIADVTHYVKPDTILEEEAYERATSVYLVDRVVPMLPERLSNFICSLRPNEEKLVFSAVFELDENADIKSEWFGKAIINSDRRFTYDEAQEVIETGKGDYSDEVVKLDELAKLLRDNRYSRGSIDFDRVEVKFDLDENLKPVGIKFKEAKDANKLIEEFMLLANKRVAEFLKNKKVTSVYRIHDEPEGERIQTFKEFIKKFGYSLNTQSKTSLTKSLNELLHKVKGSNEENVIETLAIRSMAKAEYSTHNIGHYGLSFKNYSHFTSPIRRYPDMMLHRILERVLNGEKETTENLEAKCEHSTKMENRAAIAERDSIKYMQVEFMKDKVGEEFDGVISGITEWGIYVEIIENKCEGMIPLRTLDDDYYIFDEKNYCIRGQYSENIYQLGDKLRIRIKEANLMKRQLDFEMV